VKEVPHIAASHSSNWFVAIAAFGKGIFSPDAMAFSSCGQLGSASPSSCPSGSSASSLTLTLGTPEISYILLWDPIATMSLSQNTWNPTVTAGGSAVTQPVTITNTGAPGSTLTWSATTSTTDGGNWLNISPNSDPSGLTNGATGNASESVTITANPTGLSAGTYAGTITFLGTSVLDQSNTKKTLTVTLKVTNSGATYYSCGVGVCKQTVTPGATSCATACGVSVSTLTATCTPSTVTLSSGQTSQCVLDLGGVQQNATWATVSGNAGSIGASSGVFTPSSVGTETVSGTLPDGSSANAKIIVDATQTCAPGDASCQASCSPTLTASPSTIVVPESSKLSYSCSNVTACELSGGQFGTGTSVPVSGSVTSTPSLTTTYTLTCENQPYGPTDSVTSSATVTVNGSNLCEQNPNGAGCPGQ
jgi:hypothetical protein